MSCSADRPQQVIRRFGSIYVPLSCSLRQPGDSAWLDGEGIPIDEPDLARPFQLPDALPDRYERFTAILRAYPTISDCIAGIADRVRDAYDSYYHISRPFPQGNTPARKRVVDELRRAVGFSDAELLAGKPIPLDDLYVLDVWKAVDREVPQAGWFMWPPLTRVVVKVVSEFPLPVRNRLIAPDGGIRSDEEALRAEVERACQGGHPVPESVLVRFPDLMAEYGI